MFLILNLASSKKVLIEPVSLPHLPKPENKKRPHTRLDPEEKKILLWLREDPKRKAKILAEIELSSFSQAEKTVNPALNLSNKEKALLNLIPVDKSISQELIMTKSKMKNDKAFATLKFLVASYYIKDNNEKLFSKRKYIRL